MYKIKKFILILILLATLSVLGGCKKKDNEIVIAEVTHSVFYAPQYVAIELNMFEEEGLNVSLINTNGADKTMAALLSKDAQIGLMGLEASVYVYNGGQEDYSVCFAQLTKRDGSFIVGRTKVENFTFDIFKGKEILGGRKGGMPLFILQYVLKKEGLDVGIDDPNKEVNIRTDIAFAAQAGAFVSGEADFTTLFEPTATSIEKAGNGFIVKGLGEFTESIPYTVYSTLKSYSQKNPEILEKFTKVINKAMKWVETHTAKEIAEVIHPQFLDTTLEDLEVVINNYKKIDAWCTNPLLEEEGYNLMLDIMKDANELDKYVDYNKIVDTKYSEKYK